MTADELLPGERYRIKADVALKVCAGSMIYTGTETYRGVAYHNFWDPKMRLAHWIAPEEVEPA